MALDSLMSSLPFPVPGTQAEAVQNNLSSTLGRLETIFIFNPDALWQDMTRRSPMGAVIGAGIGAIAGSTLPAASSGGAMGIGGAVVGAGVGAVAGYFGSGLLTSENLFRFRINPQTFKQDEKKIRNFDKTTRGWETAYGGEEMISLSFSGSTGYLIPPGILRDMGIHDIRLSLAYWNLSRFNRFYQQCDRRGTHLKMIFLARMFTGHLINFNYEWKADDPFQMRYSFGFKVYPDKIEGISSIFPEWLNGILNTSELAWTLGEQLGGGRGVSGVMRNLF